MSAIKTYKGEELNLKHFQGQSVYDYPFDILEDDNSTTDLSKYSAVTLDIYAKRGGTLIYSFSLNDGLTKSSNRITWNMSKTRARIYRIGLTYYHQMIGTRSNGQTDVIFYGNSEMI